MCKNWNTFGLQIRASGVSVFSKSVFIYFICENAKPVESEKAIIQTKNFVFINVIFYTQNIAQKPFLNYLFLKTSSFFYEKLNYIHNNPVEDLLVQNPEEYMFSSARNYADLDSYLDVIVETHQLITIK